MCRKDKGKACMMQIQKTAPRLKPTTSGRPTMSISWPNRFLALGPLGRGFFWRKTRLRWTYCVPGRMWMLRGLVVEDCPAEACGRFLWEVLIPGSNVRYVSAL